METQSRYGEARALVLRSVAKPASLEIKALGITTRRDTGTEESELLEMRYQHSLTIVILEELFAESRFNCF